MADRSRARAEEPHLARDVLGAMLVASHGFVIAGELTRALAVAAEHHGARFVESDRVQRIHSGPSGLVVETDRRPLARDVVVLAAGSWSGRIEIEGAVSAPVRPVRGQLLQLAWRGSPLRRVTWGERCYLVPWEDGTVLVGATSEDVGFEERTTAAGVHDLLEAASDLVPHVRTATFQGARVGLRPATPDGLPLIGWSAVLADLMYATGHYRNGVLLAPVTAMLVADAVLEKRIDPILEAARPGRFGRL